MRAGFLAIAIAASLPSLSASAQTGRIECRATANGEPASATFTARANGDQVAAGNCSAGAAVPPGTYEVTVRLDGALDQPEQKRNVTVRAGQNAQVAIDFETGMLEVQITAQGNRAAGMATIFAANGERIGTVGCGVRTHLSTGTYTVVVRHRTSEQRLEGIRITAGETRQVSAAF